MKQLIYLTLLAAAQPASAEVKSATSAGFEIEAKLIAPAPPAEVYAMLGRPSEWWNPQHTYSGDAAQLSMELRPGACFCERMPADDGAIEHMRVVYTSPGKLLRLQGGLGPLQSEGAAGTLTWSLKPVEGGTEITQTYVVGGYMRFGPEKLAPLVDGVMSEQLERLKSRFAARP